MKRKIINKWMGFISFLILVMILSLFFSVWGYSTGKYDRAKTGCECHSPTPNPTVSVDIQGLPTSYQPGMTYPLTVNVSGGPVTNKGGFNLEVSHGTLSSIDINVQIYSTPTQATHTNPNQRTWNLSWQAPVTGTGDVTFWVAGNAVNGNGGPDPGDGWNLYSTVVSEDIIFDSEPPWLYDVLIDGLDNKSVISGAVVNLTATLDDTESGNSNITGANYTLGFQNWSSSNPMNPLIPPFDSPYESVFIIINTTGWSPGTYKLYIYGRDSESNLNISSNAHATLIIVSEKEPPVISNVKINGGVSQVYPLSLIPTMNLSATVDDSGTGNSDIEGANYTIGLQNWGSSTPMALKNPPTSPTEDFEVTLQKPTETGTYEYYVYAQDGQENHNYTNYQEYALLTITDDLPPRIEQVLIEGVETKAVLAGTIVNLTAVINDSLTGNSNITGANFTLSQFNWSSTQSMDAQDGLYDEPMENVIFTINTKNWLPGSYDFYVYAWDEFNNYNITSTAYATLIISSELVPPEISNVKINGAPSQTYNLSSLPVLNLTATLDDSTTGNSNIGGANFTFGLKAWSSSQPMMPENPPLNFTKNFWAPIEAPDDAGTYLYFVYGWDSNLNYNTTNSQEYATLIIIDDLPPGISNVTLDGASELILMKGNTVTLKATLDDSKWGNSNIGGANFTIGAGTWDASMNMNALDSVYDSPVEVVVFLLDATDWMPGTYQIYVHGQDNANPTGNGNISSTAFATLVIRKPPSNLSVSVGEQRGVLLLSWEEAVYGDIAGFSIYRSISQGGSYIKISSVNSSVNSYTDSGLEDDVTYYYVITAYDSHQSETSFSTESSATTLPEPEPKGDESQDITFIILIGLIAVFIVIFILLLVWKRKNR